MQWIRTGLCNGEGACSRADAGARSARRGGHNEDAPDASSRVSADAAKPRIPSARPPPCACLTRPSSCRRPDSVALLVVATLLPNRGSDWALIVGNTGRPHGTPAIVPVACAVGGSWRRRSQSARFGIGCRCQQAWDQGWGPLPKGGAPCGGKPCALATARRTRGGRVNCGGIVGCGDRMGCGAAAPCGGRLRYRRRGRCRPRRRRPSRFACTPRSRWTLKDDSLSAVLRASAALTRGCGGRLIGALHVARALRLAPRRPMAGAMHPMGAPCALGGDVGGSSLHLCGPGGSWGRFRAVRGRLQSVRTAPAWARARPASFAR